MPITTAPASRSPIQRIRRMGIATVATAAIVALMGQFAPQAHAATGNTVIEAVQVPAWVETDGQRRPAQPGQALGTRDKAVTAEASRMVLRLPDQSLVKLGEKTEFQIESLSNQRNGVAQPSEMKAALRLISGIFRYATDYTSKALGNKRDISLQLRTATVGIRGTDFWSMTDADHDAVCLFEGKVAVERDQQDDVVLEKPGAFWVVRTNLPEGPAGQATPEQLQKFISQAELTPGSGVLLEGGRWRAVAGLLSSAAEAAALRARLATAGYPADIRKKGARYEVRINDFATELDAQTVLDRLKGDAKLGVAGGRVALAAR
jgi:hypothetical protein